MNAQARTGGKGGDLEETLRAYFWQAGYFVARGVPFRVDGDDVTDIDLWLYERPAASTRRRLIVDVKNKKSPKAAERIVWTKGLQAALGVDGAIVATTDSRPSTRRFSRSMGVSLLDGDAITRLVQSSILRRSEWLTAEEFNSNIKRLDEKRRSTQWRTQIHEARSSLLVGFGVSSANTNLAACSFFGMEAADAYPNSEQAQYALRLLYLTAAMVTISLDFLLADQAFKSFEDKRRSIVASIRFGQPDGVNSNTTIRAAIGLALRYADNGNAVAKQIENGFYSDASNIPAEIIADHIARFSSTDALFNAARELENASLRHGLVPFDNLSIEAKSILGVFLDFNSVSRQKIAEAYTGAVDAGLNPKSSSIEGAPSASLQNQDRFIPHQDSPSSSSDD